MMTLANDIQYFQRRESEERDAARTATNASLKEIFNVLADRYADRVWSLMEEQYDVLAQHMAPLRHTVVFEEEQPPHVPHRAISRQQ